MTRLILILSLVGFMACSAKNKDEKKTAVNKSLPNQRKEVVCFLYHRFGDRRYPSTNISLQDFEAHLNYLKTNNFQLLTFSEAIDYLKSDTPLQKVAVLTVDDGYSSFYQNAIPLLKKYESPATLFINTKTVGAGDYMNWEEIKAAHNQGIEIGNHTHSHAYFLGQPEAKRYTAFEEEIVLTQNLIKDHIGLAPETFAYPYGELDPKMKSIVEKHGFKAAAAQNSGVIYNETDLMQCPRFPMSENYAALDQFKIKAETKALRITKQMPHSFIIPKGELKPTLKISFESDHLQLEQLQCFIQGSECQKDQVLDENGQVTLTITPSSSIHHRRRTLYTITVPDDKGQWRWFSHLWINAGVE